MVVDRICLGFCHISVIWLVVVLAVCASNLIAIFSPVQSNSFLAHRQSTPPGRAHRLPAVSCILLIWGAAVALGKLTVSVFSQNPKLFVVMWQLLPVPNWKFFGNLGCMLYIRMDELNFANVFSVCIMYAMVYFRICECKWVAFAIVMLTQLHKKRNVFWINIWTSQLLRIFTASHAMFLVSFSKFGRSGFVFCQWRWVFQSVTQ